MSVLIPPTMDDADSDLPVIAEQPAERLCNLYSLIFNEPDWEDQTDSQRRCWEEFAKRVERK